MLRRDENKNEETEGCESKRQSVLADSTQRSGSPSSATPAEHNRAPGFSCGLLQEVMNYTWSHWFLLEGAHGKTHTQLKGREVEQREHLSKMCSINTDSSRAPDSFVMFLYEPGSDPSFPFNKYNFFYSWFIFPLASRTTHTLTHRCQLILSAAQACMSLFHWCPLIIFIILVSWHFI